MASTYLTPTVITRESLRILHQKLNFISKITRSYDDRFAKDGAKIGDSLTIRLPNQYEVTTGATMTAQDVTEASVILQVATQKHVGMSFTSSDLTLKIDDFSERYIEPAMSVLAASMEADAMTMFKNVYNGVNNVGSAINLNKVWSGRKLLQDNLAPMSKRYCLLNTQDAVDFMDAAKGLFNPSGTLSDQYTEGDIGRFGGLDFAENTLIPNVTTGDAASATTCTVNGANQTGASITIANGSSKTFKVGDIVTFAGCNRVHPETKADTGVLQQFVVTADAASTTLTVSPSIVVTGGTQNVSASPTTGGAIVKVGGASTVYKPSVVFQKEAFAFATADLIMPKGVDFAAREVMDGISMRIVRDFDIVNDKMLCRADVLYGYKTLRPQFAARILSN